ncbi:hypothetical protein OHC33_002387 [Knufia fluminis]|uniref:Tetratricopeptide SHNi-TPR domain-containing protein n=1 Tax=Knufia fluminis TaxID=191047 RepID=A0AAN8EJJ5_9EURO|nr:hypothetical protein OHC33_002387 [Knufia fluminis]
MADSTEVPKSGALEAEGNDQTTDQSQDESPQEKLTDLTARATALYAVKKYEEAAELYSEATEVQAEVRGEMAEENADLLFAYGRCLFYVAQKTSTVLGGTAASAQLKGSDKKPSKKRKANGTIKSESSANAAAPTTTLETITETSQPADVVPAVDANPEAAKPSNSEKPLFQIEGDAPDWDDTDDEEEEAADGEEEEEEEDDFNTAFEILDLSRILYLRTLEKQDKDSPSTRDLRTRISDIYDLQAEISLEGERFDAAVTDLRSCLELKQSLYDPSSSLLAECHYKLSLALEAASQVQQRDADGNPVGEITIDWTLRNEAVSQQESAIHSCNLRVSKETKELEDLPAEKKQKAKEQIEDVQDMITAMEQRLEELRKPPVSVKAETEKDAQQELMGSVLGQVLGGGKGEQKEKLAEIMAGANDLSGMVKRKKPKLAADAGSNGDATGNAAQAPQGQIQTDVEVRKGKRKLENIEPETATEATNGASAQEPGSPVKKVRIADVID